MLVGQEVPLRPHDTEIQASHGFQSCERWGTAMVYPDVNGHWGATVLRALVRCSPARTPQSCWRKAASWAARAVAGGQGPTAGLL
jgi:hypothetical protein